MERVLFSILETSIIMSGAILLLMLFSKLFAGKTRPAKRHLCWLIVAVGLLIPYRPALLTVPLPQPQSYHEAEALLFTDSSLMLDWAGFEHSFEGGTYFNPDSAVMVDPAISDCNIFVSGLEPGGILDTEYNPATTLENPSTLETLTALENPEEIILISVTETEEMAAISIYPAELTILRDILLPSLLAVWALGALGIFLFYALRHIRFIRRVKKNSHEITFGPLHNLLIRIRCHAGIKRKVRLMTSPFITVPMMYGFFRPVIILPAYVLTSDEEQQRLIILHEALHIKRGDIIARLLCLTAVAVHWFNPLVHLMNRLALDESERACDDAVLRYSGVETRKQYSHTLLQVARQDAEAHDALNHDALAHEALAHALTSGGKNIKNRLKNILSQQKPGRLALLICTALMVVGVGIFSVIHFGGGSEDEPEYTQDGTYPDSGSYALLQAPGDVFRIFTPMGIDNIRINAVADTLQASHGVEFEITSYDESERNYYTNHMLSLFAGGLGPDIFVVDTLLYPFIENGFLMDINELIPDRSLFYENVLAGFEVNGRLYTMPMSFNFNTIGINNSLPRDILDRFAALETASASQLIEIYLDLINTHPEFSDFYFANHWTGGMMDGEITYALDFHNKTASFPDGTAQLLYRINNHRDEIINPGGFRGTSTVEMMEALHVDTVFHLPIGISAVSDAFFPFEQEFFTAYIPITDERGALLNNSIDTTVAVSANADPALAWLFIEALLKETATESQGHIHLGCIHISRLHAREYLELRINHQLDLFTLRPITINEEYAVLTAADRIMAHAERPSVRPAFQFLMPRAVTNPAMRRLADGDINAETAVQEMVNDMQNWLRQQRHIEAYVPALPPDETAAALPVRTLTVHANNHHTALFQQAARAMNESWQARGIPYTFELVMDDWSWPDTDEWLIRFNRLQMELMVGQGPDIFIETNLPNLRALARGGFLADIYTLMDNCTLTQRGDFFENVLAAYEFDGGLYQLPTSFMVRQAGIRAQLPQEYIDAHTAREFVTLRDMYETYYSLRNTPGYTHLRGGFASLAGALDLYAVQAAAMPFINWEARTADLTNPRFVQDLTLLYRVFDGRRFIDDTTQSNAPGAAWYAPGGAAGDNVFEMSSFRFSAANAFFPRTENHFIEYRPIADDDGRLLLNRRNNAWAVLSVTAAGQPELAWEFIVYLLRTYPRATGRAAVCPIWGTTAYWAGQSIGTPILRENAHMPRRMFATAADPGRYGRFMDWYFSGPAEEYIDAAMARLAELNEMPMTLDHAGIPLEVVTGPEGINAMNFFAGAISAEAFAQLIHNAVSLWLIE